jgi:hypothetical protein
MANIWDALTASGPAECLDADGMSVYLDHHADGSYNVSTGGTNAETGGARTGELSPELEAAYTGIESMKAGDSHEEHPAVKSPLYCSNQRQGAHIYWV